MRRLIIAFLAMLAAAAPLPAADDPAQEMNATLDALFGEHVPYRNFFERLKQAIANNDRAAVAAMIDYPFRARIGGKSVTLRDPAHFIAEFDRIVTARVRQAVLDQQYETLFANWQGVMIGDGEIWFSAVGKKGEIRITAIND